MTVSPAGPDTAPAGPPGAAASGAAAGGGHRPSAVRQQRVALVDLLDRVLARGVVVVGDVTLSIADVDLVTISLRALISSVGGDDLVPGPGADGGR